MMAMTALVFANVVARYGFGASLIWAEELSRFAMIWTAFLGAGLAMRHGQLVAVDLVQDLAAPSVRHALRIAVALAMAGFLVALIVLGVQFVEFSWGNRTAVLRLPKGIPYLAVPIGAGLALLHLVLQLPGFLRRDWLALEELDRDAPAAAVPDELGESRA